MYIGYKVLETVIKQILKLEKRDFLQQTNFGPILHVLPVPFNHLHVHVL